MNPIRINVAVESDDPAIVQRAVETLSRAMAGLALEGVETYLSAWTLTDDVTEDVEDTG